MTDQPHRDDLTQLRAELAAQRAVTSAQQARLARLERRRRFPRRFLPVALMGLLVALLPLSMLAAGPFGDLNTGHDAANADIQAIADAGITKGCNPPDFTAYCPNDLVTREQMASFLARTAGIGGNKPVAHAARLATTNSTGNTMTYAADELVRVALQTRGDTLILTNQYQAYGAPLTLTAPVQGYVQVSGVLELRVNAAAGCPCRITVRLTNQDLPGGFIEQTVPATTDYRQTVPLVWAFDAKPGMQSIGIEAVRDNGTGMVEAYYSRTTALFVPFAETGAGTLEIGNTSPSKKP